MESTLSLKARLYGGYGWRIGSLLSNGASKSLTTSWTRTRWFTDTLLLRMILFKMRLRVGALNSGTQFKVPPWSRLSNYRNEWKIHFLGMPLNSRDCFFSTHSSTHYALYLWQPNRSAWGEDDPIEALAIWDISRSSPYHPSEDPTGRGKPVIEEGSTVIRRLSFADLDFYKIRQRSTPIIRNLELDENHVYVIEEDHRWLVGQQASHHLPRLHKVKRCVLEGRKVPILDCLGRSAPETIP